ncbi:DUF4124 domain-containing protein [Microbulbifer rhizosphaerae]|uniref:DUF4124 domain-containing protein n=1 Tax=Microbulbifer rhizosphaerae TaxID=1562603 RepID=A0A7W4WBD3_9GAMM|nr:hypothetical protein [Microbulbifer rhizosphaerae]
MIRAGIGIIALLLSAAAATAEEVYRWVDDEGKVHFGDRPPAQAAAKNIEGELRPINSADGGTARNAPRQQAKLQQEYESRRQRDAQQRQQQMARACHNARRQLRILQGRVTFVGGDGKEVKMTERERQRQAEQLKREIARVCS